MTLPLSEQKLVMLWNSKIPRVTLFLKTNTWFVQRINCSEVENPCSMKASSDLELSYQFNSVFTGYFPHSLIWSTIVYILICYILTKFPIWTVLGITAAWNELVCTVINPHSMKTQLSHETGELREDSRMMELPSPHKVETLLKIVETLVVISKHRNSRYKFLHHYNNDTYKWQHFQVVTTQFRIQKFT